MLCTCGTPRTARATTVSAAAAPGHRGSSPSPTHSAPQPITPTAGRNGVTAIGSRQATSRLAPQLPTTPASPARGSGPKLATAAAGTSTALVRGRATRLATGDSGASS